MNKEEAKAMIKEILEAWDIRLGEMYLSIIYSKIDNLTDDKIQKSCQLLRKYL
ncbi:hypothetical protein J4226_00240 [Candidatus Pacearchaeota archaeon]|nr:hypothetical protein [Candidatus Pacearchaeota archaeon]